MTSAAAACAGGATAGDIAIEAALRTARSAALPRRSADLLILATPRLQRPLLR
jgi:hypothetical protein